MDTMTGETKAGDSCPLCDEGVLAVSPSGRHLICSQCRRISVTKPSGTGGNRRRSAIAGKVPRKRA
jgi:hypothetical protein